MNSNNNQNSQQFSFDSQFDVAVILINYNSSNDTKECISSILLQTKKSLSVGIVIVDNASLPDDYNNLESKLSELGNEIPIFLFKSKINTGFSAGNMLGTQFINSKYYFFLNNDCCLQNDCINILFNFCESNPDVSLCSPQLYDVNGKPHTSFNYFPFLLTKIFGLGILRLTYGKRYISRKQLHDVPVQVDVVSGSQMFTRASAFNEIGGFDTTFFLYCEEEDIALRFANKKHRTYLVPEARNLHKGGGSTKPSLDIKKEFYISFLYLYRKHFGLLQQQLLKLILIVRLLKKGLFKINSLKLALFIASGAHTKNSLRHKQPIQNKILKSKHN